MARLVNDRWWKRRRHGRYLMLRDLFSDAQLVLVAGESRPGNGLRRVTGALLKNLGGALRGGSQISSPAWGSSKLVYTDNAGAGFARISGRTFCALVTLEDYASDMVLSWATATNISDARSDGHGWVLENGDLAVALPSLKLTFDANQTNIRSMQYLVGVTLNDLGAVVWLSTIGADDITSPAAGMTDQIGVPAYPSARILWADYVSTTTPLYPSFSFYDSGNGSPTYPNGQCIQDARVVDVASWAAADALALVSDRFTRGDSASLLGGNWLVDNGTFGISSNKAYTPGGSGFLVAYLASGLQSGDGIVQCDITVPTTTTTAFGIIVRRQDASNFIRIWNNATTNIAIQTWVAGAFGATVANTSFTWTAGQTYRLTVVMKGAKYRVLIDNVDVYGSGWQTDSNSRFITATGVGLYGNNGTNFTTTRWDNFVAFPLTFTLPSEIAAGAAPVIYAAGSTLASDTFTDTNSVRLNAHTPVAGSAWVESAGTWTVQSNRASCSMASGVNVAYQPVQRSVEAQVDIITPSSFATGRIRAGIAVRYASITTFLIARLYKDPAQIGADEIELLEGNGSTTPVVHKVNLGTYFAVSTTYTLKVQIAADPNGGNDLLHVWLDGKPRISYKLSVTNTNTGVGLYVGNNTNDLDDGCVFDNWTVKAL